jgi:hypothetical protein
VSAQPGSRIVAPVLLPMVGTPRNQPQRLHRVRAPRRRQALVADNGGNARDRLALSMHEEAGHVVARLGRVVKREAVGLGDRYAGGRRVAMDAVEQALAADLQPLGGRRPEYPLRALRAAPRRRLLELLSSVDLRLVLSGHTHQYLDRMVGRTRHLWLPSTAYIFPDSKQELIREKVTGLCVLKVTGDQHRIALVRPEGVERHNLLDRPFYAAFEAARRRQLTVSRAERAGISADSDAADDS